MKKGFTVVEVLLVVLLIGAIVAVSLLLLGKEPETKASLFYRPSHEVYVK